jgi:hypothetical protein
MEPGPLIVLGLMWLVVNAVRKAGSKPPDRPRTPPGPPVPPTRSAGSQAGTLRPRLPENPTPPDASQREGARLERLLRELGRTLDQAAGPGGRTPDRRLPSAEDVEERGSLEASPEARSLEDVPARHERAIVDQDDEAEQVVQQRLAAAEGNASALTRVDHEAFDQRIRQEPADKTATRGYSVRQLRGAVVWREILGKPVSLRGEGEEW